MHFISAFANYLGIASIPGKISGVYQMLEAHVMVTAIANCQKTTTSVGCWWIAIGIMIRVFY